MSPDTLPSSADTNGWNEWSRFVLSELKRHNRMLEDGRKEAADRHAKVMAEIAALKVKAGVVGLAGGMIPAVVVLIYFLVG